MKVFQQFCTYGKRGLSEPVQTYSMSDGISETERSEIEHYAIYVPPYNLPSQPSAEEIENLFPIAFSFFQLGSGRYGVCQTRRIGANYSEHYGSYFCHALVLDEGYWPFYPIQLWGSSIFKQGLTDKEIYFEHETEPPPLPALELRDLPQYLNHYISFDNVAEFIKQEKHGTALEKMLTAIINYQQTQRRLILCDHYGNILYWMAALQMAFPIKLAHQMKLTTYISDPETTHLLISHTPRRGTRFTFSEMQRDYSFYIFDFIENNSSEVEGRYDINQFIKVSYFLSKENFLFAFHRFLELLDHPHINPEIEIAYHLFRISCARLDDIPNQSIIAAIDFANNHAPSEILVHLSENLNQILEAVSEKLNLKTAQIVTRFLFKVARQNRQKPHLETAYQFFFNALDQMLVSGEITLQQGLEFNNTIRSLDDHAYGQEFAIESIKPNRLRALSETVPLFSNPQWAQFYVQMMLNNLRVADFSWEPNVVHADWVNFLKNGFKSLFQSKPHLFQVLKTAADNHEMFVQIVNLAISQAAEPETVVDMILDCFRAVLPEKEAYSIRARLIELNQYAFVFKEFLKLLGTAKRKSYFFWEYHQHLFSNYQEFSNHYFYRAVKVYLTYLPPKLLEKECTKLLSFSAMITDDGVLTKLVQLVEESIPLASPNTQQERKIRALSKLKTARNINTSPNITGLVIWGFWLESESVSQLSLSQLFESEPPDFRGLDVDRYQEYLEWVLPALLPFLTTIEEHGLLFNRLRVVDGIGFDRELILSFTVYLSWLLKKNNKLGQELLMNFLIYYIAVMPTDSELLTLHRLFWGDVIGLILRMPKTYLSNVEAALSDSEKLNNSMNYFKALQKEVEYKQTRSLIGWLKKPFR
jgi:hypothetical protein